MLCRDRESKILSTFVVITRCRADEDVLSRAESATRLLRITYRTKRSALLSVFGIGISKMDCQADTAHIRILPVTVVPQYSSGWRALDRLFIFADKQPSKCRMEGGHGAASVPVKYVAMYTVCGM